MYGTFPYAADPFGDAPIGGTTAYPLSLDVTRAVIELIGSNDQRDVQVSRLVIEVIGDDPFVFSDTTQLTSRLVAEVIHSLAEAPGRLTTVSRAVLEVIGTVAYLGAGLVVPTMSLTGANFLLAFDASWSAGRLHYSDGNGRGLFIEGDGATLTLRYTDGVRSAVATAPDTGGIRVLAFSTGGDASSARVWLDASALAVTPTGGSWSFVDLQYLNLQRDPAFPQSGVMHELMVYPGDIPTPQIDYLRQYLTCKWVTPGCNPRTDLPPAP